MYEVFEHTADVGLRVRGGDLDEVFAAAAAGLYSLIAIGDEGVSGARREFRIEGDRPDLLLLDWLNELVYTFDTERLVLDDFTCRVDDTGLQATAVAEPFDPARHLPHREVKAITYHGLRLEEEDDGWVAEVIVDV